MINPFVIPAYGVNFRLFVLSLFWLFLFSGPAIAQDCGFSIQLLRRICVNDAQMGQSFFASIKIDHNIPGAQWEEAGGRRGSCNRSVNFGPFPLMDTTLVFEQIGDSGCSFSLSLSPPTCSDTVCHADVVFFEPHVDDNSTLSLTNDDVFYLWARIHVSNPASPFIIWVLPDTTLFHLPEGLNQLGPFPIGQDIPLVITDQINPLCSQIEWINSPLPDEGSSTISGRTWWDENANGAQDTDEPYTPGSEVSLLKIPSDPRVLQINASGETGQPGEVVCIKFTAFNFYELSDLYIPLRYDTSKLIFVKHIDRALTGICKNCVHAHAPGHINPGWSAGTGQPALSLPQGTLLFELCFQIIAPGEAPVSLYLVPAQSRNELTESQPVFFFKGGVNLSADPASHYRQTAYTDAQGRYSFDSLQAGRYVLQFAKPGNYAFSATDVAADSIDSDVNAITATTGPNDLGAGEAIRHVDAGVFYQPEISGRVWIDKNRNSRQDPEETGAPLALVKLKPYAPGSTSSPVISIDNEEVFAGANRCITVFAEQLNRVNGIQFGIRYNPDQLRFTGTTNLNLPWLSGAGSFTQYPNEIAFSWVFAPLNGFSRIERAPLFSLCFDVLESGHSALYFSNQIIDPEYVEIFDVFYPGTILGDEVYFTDHGLENHRILMTSHDGIYHFSNIPSGQYTLEFLPAYYAGSFAERQAAMVPDHLNSDVNPQTGSTAVFYFSGDTPITGLDAGLWLSPTALLHGQVYRDPGGCLPQSSGPGLANRLLRIRGAGFEAYRTTDASGRFTCSLPPGTYVVSLEPQYALDVPCQPAVAVTVTEQAEVSFPIQAADDCPLLEVQAGISQLQRCAQNSLYLQYHNRGSAVSPDALLTLYLPDGLSFESASVSPDSIVDGRVYWGLGNLLPEAQGSIQVVLFADCNLTTGASRCVEARITPAVPCPEPSAAWSGAALQVTAACNGADVDFTLTNVGTADMSAPISYIVIEDGVMLMQQPLQLSPLTIGQEQVVSYPANGSTYRLEASQEPFFPFPSSPSATIEGCGLNADGGFSTGFLGQFPPDDEAPHIDIECHAITEAPASPEKQAQPEGYGPEHYALARTRIDYTIRFQNTTGDSLRWLEVRDTLSPWLDLSTFQAGASSHPCQFSIEPGRVLVISFPSAVLPDSNTNATASQGFVKFSIQTIGDVPAETVIYNTAYIHTDNGTPPTATNAVFHTIGDDFIIIVSAEEITARSAAALRIYPNPTGSIVWIELAKEEEVSAKDHHLCLRDTQGKICLMRSMTENPVSLNVENLSPGIYFIEITDETGLRLARGRLIRQ